MSRLQSPACWVSSVHTLTQTYLKTQVSLADTSGFTPGGDWDMSSAYVLVAWPAAGRLPWESYLRAAVPRGDSVPAYRGSFSRTPPLPIAPDAPECPIPASVLTSSPLALLPASHCCVPLPHRLHPRAICVLRSRFLDVGLDFFLLAFLLLPGFHFSSPFLSSALPENSSCCKGRNSGPSIPTQKLSAWPHRGRETSWAQSKSGS